MKQHELFSNGLRFVFSKNKIKVYDAEKTHNYIGSFIPARSDTVQDLEVEIAYWLKDYKVI